MLVTLPDRIPGIALGREEFVKSCPNCGWSNEDQNRFCENCGADFEGLRAQGRAAENSTSTWQPLAQPETPLRGYGTAGETSPSAPDWRMAPLPPEEMPGKRGRRLWLWILTGLLLACMISCAGGFVWLGYTDSGKDFQTSVADRATEVSE